MTQPEVSPDASARTTMIGFAAGPLQTNCYLLFAEPVDPAEVASYIEQPPAPATASPTTSAPTTTSPQSISVVDPGMGSAPVIQRIADQLHCRIDAVYLTHGHIDHMRDAHLLGAPVYLHAADIPMAQHPEFLGPELAMLFDTDHMGPIADLRELGDTATLGGEQWEVHHMPGHSPGSVMYRRDGHILGGDVLFRQSIGRTDLPLSNPADMADSLRRLRQTFADGDIVLPGHGPQTTIGEEKASNPYLQGQPL
ncbi:MBL fold metallo-hydrolase [Corynebacterium heidelbergense]|uniref:MBL fold metallo-hydrolase n=1 Tax=Corynebacterium heidelbergense TaxID=2055947 RepID=A0A364V7S6_9CORY|nr:MBL fold metallo-hydrolase [Corynebacterium heidelbergense]RAV32702.1 MBL fold metallo-hydrolase [Corynebacterium heidelbergense]